MLIINKRPKIGSYLLGASNDLDSAALSLAQEWAFVPVIKTIKNKSGKVRLKGQSYYSDGVNKSGTDPSVILRALKDGRSAIELIKADLKLYGGASYVTK